MSINKQEIQNLLQKHLDERLLIESISPVSGGDICESFKVKCQTKDFFLKLHQTALYSMLSSEATNLRTLESTNTIRTPTPLTHGKTNSYSFLVLEYLEFVNSGSYTELGIALAKLHLNYENYFGWTENNWIGSTIQSNIKSTDWITFWRDYRLGYQLKLAEKNHAPKSHI